ncbi:hypothetical protein BGP_6514 [Beggiatoa sp. PS]|nr:hypothetical protein BGP_6514 [Beggiatoa sp. PS]
MVFSYWLESKALALVLYFLKLESKVLALVLYFLKLESKVLALVLYFLKLESKALALVLCKSLKILYAKKFSGVFRNLMIFKT